MLLNTPSRSRRCNASRKKCRFSIAVPTQMHCATDCHWCSAISIQTNCKLRYIQRHLNEVTHSKFNRNKHSESNKKRKDKKGNGNGVPFYTCMRRFGRMRWSIPVDAKGDARCCNPADWSHRAMTASPASTLAGPALCRDPPPAWSYSAAAAAAALLCCIWPPMWRCCARLCGANFQASKKTTANAKKPQQFTDRNPKSTENNTKNNSRGSGKSETEQNINFPPRIAIQSPRVCENRSK